tara:strand:+ start:8938 stop:9381 length:444 start_codon:yes stop_codon:yes gene_type:complete
MDNSGRDFETGLSQQQLQAAKLLADGWSIPKAAETVGCHYNTVRNWKKNIPAFRRVVANYRAPNRQPIPVTPMREMTPDALDNRMAMLVAPSISAMSHILGNPDSNDQAKVAVSKFVMSTMYQRLVTDADVAPKAMAELRDALRIIK